MAKKTRVIYRNRGGKKHHRRPGFTLPLAVVAGFASPVGRAGSRFINEGWQAGISEISMDMIGINPYANPIKFDWQYLKYGLVPVALGVGVHKLAGMFGLNRMIARAGVPFLRI